MDYTEKIIVKCIVLISLLLFCNISIAQNPNFHIYLCFGQSNMEGQGIIEEQDTISIPRFKVLQAMDCPNLNREKEKWYPAVAPTCQCKTKLSVVDYFGRTMVENLPDSISIGIINVAVGGSDIRLFDKDIYKAYNSKDNAKWFANKVASYNGNPYEYFINLAKIAQKEGVIKGILLHQGESNTGQVEWLTYVAKIYNTLLTDLILQATEVPLLAGELVSVEENCCARMNAIINELPTVIPTAHIISSKDCPAQDRAHFNSEGYRILGKRYAMEMLRLEGF